MGSEPTRHGGGDNEDGVLPAPEAGETIDDFLEGFPSVTQSQVIAFLEEAKDRVIESVS